MKINDNKLNWSLNVIARVFVGCVFLFSSFVKGVDPMGTAFKITEYLTTWSFGSLSFEWLVPMAPVFSMSLIVAEFTVGMMLIFGAFRRLSAWALVLMMLFFTCSTLYDAITNKVTDCGCFGDFVKLTNWQTFWKNVVLDVPAVWIFLTRNLRRKRRFERDSLITIFSIVLMVIFGMYNINNEPCIDFRAWKVGNQMMPFGEQLEAKSYVTYRNKTTGEEMEFESKKLMDYWADTAWREAWEFVDSRVEDPYEIQADGFSMLGPDGDEYAKDIIGNPGYVMIATIHHLDEVDAEGIRAISRVHDFCLEKGVNFVLLCTLDGDIEPFLYDNNLSEIIYYFADTKAIETMLRSNPGFVLMKDAKVEGKWHYKNSRKILNLEFAE